MNMYLHSSRVMALELIIILAVDPPLNWNILSNQQWKMVNSWERNIIHLCPTIKLSVSSYQVHVINFKRKIIVASQTFLTFFSDDSGVVRILWRCPCTASIKEMCSYSVKEIWLLCLKRNTFQNINSYKLKAYVGIWNPFCNSLSWRNRKV